MALFLARLIMLALGTVYAILGIYMVALGITKELAKRTLLPMLVIIGNPPPAMFEDPDFDENYEGDFVPFAIAGLMLTIIGLSFIFNIP